MKLNSFVDAYLLAGRFIDADVIDALNRTRVAADDYQSLSLRQFDLQISLAVMFGSGFDAFAGVYLGWSKSGHIHRRTIGSGHDSC